MEAAKRARQEKMASPGRKKSKQSPPASRPETQQQLTSSPDGFNTHATGGGAFLTEAPVEATINNTANLPPMTQGSDADPSYEHTALQTGMPAKREIVDMILVWEDKMNQLIYADRHGYFVYAEEDDNS